MYIYVNAEKICFGIFLFHLQITRTLKLTFAMGGHSGNQPCSIRGGVGVGGMG